MNKSKEIKAIAYVRNSVKANLPEDLIREGLKKAFTLDDNAISALFLKSEIKKELEKLTVAINPVLLQEVKEKISTVKQERKPIPVPVQIQAKVIALECDPIRKVCGLAAVVTAGTPTEYTYHYFRKFLQLTDDIEKNLDILVDFYIERMSSSESNDRIRETLHEYIRTFDLRGLDGADIVADRISMVSRKAEPSKHSLGYLVGCLRNAMLYGLASINTKVDEFLFTTFEEKLQIPLTETGRNLLLGMVSLYGVMDVLMLINKKHINMELLLLSGLETLLREDIG